MSECVLYQVQVTYIKRLSSFLEPPEGTGAGATSFFFGVNLEMAVKASLSNTALLESPRMEMKRVIQSPIARSTGISGVVKKCLSVP